MPAIGYRLVPIMYHLSAHNETPEVSLSGRLVGAPLVAPAHGKLSTDVEWTASTCGPLAIRPTYTPTSCYIIHLFNWLAWCRIFTAD